MIRNILVSVLVFLLPLYMVAQSKNGGGSEELNSDRPSISQSPKIIPRGTIQLETGYEFEKDETALNQVKHTLYPTTLVRIGILKKAELRLNADYEKDITEIMGSTDAIDTERGFNNVQVGTKIDIIEGQGAMPDIGFIGVITLPVGNQVLRPPHVAPEGALLFNNKISEKVEIQYNAGYRKSQEQGEYHGEAFYAISGSVKITDQVEWGLEFAGQKSKDATAENLLDTSFLLKILPNLQMDIIGGLGLNKSSPDYFAGGGVTWRLPR